MKRALAVTAVTGAALGYVARSEARRLLGARARRRQAGQRLREALRAEAWVATAVAEVSRRLSDGERPVSVTVLVVDGDGTRRAYTARQDSGHVVVMVQPRGRVDRSR